MADGTGETGEGQPAAIENYAALEHRLVAWAPTQPALRAAVVVGSRARPAPADPAADLDLVLFVTTVEPYAAGSDWLRALGPLWLAVRNATGRGDPEWLALYAGGFKADFVLTPTVAQAGLADRLRASPYRNVYQRGVRVLFNAGGPLDLPADLSRPLPVARVLPDAAAFTAAVEAAWYAADRGARQLARGDQWRAKQQIDGTLKQRLVEMLAWHAHAQPGAPPQTWDDGRHLGEWAEAQAFSALPATFGAYEGADLWRALFATLELYHRLARATAARAGYPYRADIEAQLADWLAQLQRRGQPAEGG